MWFLFFFFCFGFVNSLPFFGPVLRNCPSIAAQDGLQLQQLMGSWRLAYLFIDTPEELEEDNTCVITEIMQVNETELDLLLYLDGRKDEFTIERSTTEFKVTVLAPGEWAIHAPLAAHGFIHATVISFSEHHMIITFCTTQPPIPGLENFQDSEPISRIPREDHFETMFRNENQNALFDFDELGRRLGRGRYHKRSLRRLERSEATRAKPAIESFHGEIRRFLEESNKPNSEKHLWTAIFVKNNNVSALKFVEFASVLMKYGYDVTKGELISFGKCDVQHK